jgi:uncharacterized protein (DUF427 family)
MPRSVPLLTPDARILRARAHWRFRGQERPPFAEPPGQGQRSVWDFPRPPVIEPVPEPLRALVDDQPVAETRHGVRVLETAGAPTYYFPPEDTDQSLLRFGAEVSVCEWKGIAQTIAVGTVDDAGWRYTQVFEEFADLWQWPSFYAGRVQCYVGDEPARPQPGGYYGGWVTADLVGPIKGDSMLTAAQWSQY